MQAMPAAMRMQHRGFKFDVAAHALLIEDLTKERLQAEQTYIQACPEYGGIGCTIPDTPERKRALLQAILTGGELDRWRRREVGRAVNQAQRPAPSGALPAYCRTGADLDD